MDETEQRVAERLAGVCDDIRAAEKRSGRAPGSVRLIAVSKRKPAALVRAAYAAGQRDFGENYGQELLAKADALRDLPSIRWHHIGHLQRNKVKSLVGVVHLFHGVDNQRLVAAIARRAAAAGVDARVLLQVNISGEESKSGCRPSELSGLVQAVRRAERLELCGLMGMPPGNSAAGEGARPFFTELAALAATHALTQLSMGMSGDYQVAIEQGATWVRVGSAIFGVRDQ